MVECELLMPESIVPTFTVLIDTWWNVNSTAEMSQTEYKVF